MEMKIDNVKHMILTKKQDDENSIVGYDYYVSLSSFNNQKVENNA